MFFLCPSKSTLYNSLLALIKTWLGHKQKKKQVCFQLPGHFAFWLPNLRTLFFHKNNTKNEMQNDLSP